MERQPVQMPQRTEVKEVLKPIQTYCETCGKSLYYAGVTNSNTKGLAEGFKLDHIDIYKGHRVIIV